MDIAVLEAAAVMLQADWPLESIWSSAVGYVAFLVILTGGIGLMGKRLSTAIYPAFLTFVYFGLEGDIGVLRTTAIVTLVVMSMGVAFKLWRLEGPGEGVGS